MQTLFIFYLVFGILQILLALPLLYEKIPPNVFYGMRVRDTLNDPSLWYPANRYLARWMLISGGLFLAGTILLYFVPWITVDSYAMACMLIFAISFTIGLLLSFRYLRQLKKNNADRS
jgi:uncharacterized membrane protein